MNEKLENTSTEISKPTSYMKPTIIILLIMIVLGAGYYFNAPDLLKQSLEWIKTQGVTGYGVFLLLYIFSCIFLIPGTVLTLGAGVIYGVILGSIIVSISSTLGAAVAFFAGRYLARGFVEKKIEGNSSFKAIDDAVAREGGKIVFLIRLSPAFPFSLMNYAFGITKVNFISYFFASWLGMMPGTVMYVYLGSLSGDLATGGSSPMEWVLKGVGLIATIVVTVYVTKIAKKALQTKIVEPDETTTT